MTIACPECGSHRSDVRDSRHGRWNRHLGQTIRRRRVCRSCKARYSTYEVDAAKLDTITMLFDQLAPLVETVRRWNSTVDTAMSTLSDEGNGIDATSSCA